MKQRLFDIAKRLSKKSDSKFQLGCVIIRKNIPIGFGYNQMTKTHPKCNTWGNYIHSELHALIGLDFKDTKGSTAYIYREKKDGSLGMARPCRVCYDTLRLAGIKKICYTTEKGYKEEKM